MRTRWSGLPGVRLMSVRGGAGPSGSPTPANRPPFRSPGPSPAKSGARQCRKAAGSLPRSRKRREIARNPIVGRGNAHGEPVSRILFPGPFPGAGSMTIPLDARLPGVSSCQPEPPGQGGPAAVSPPPEEEADRPRARFLFGIAPGGACHAGPVARPPVRSYRTVSPLPPKTGGGLFSVALSLGSPPPGVTRHHSPVESGLSSGPKPRGHPALRAPQRLAATRPRRQPASTDLRVTPLTAR